jgi:hypothetical protein
MPDSHDAIPAIPTAPSVPEAYTPPALRGPRSFTDSVGVTWSVHEIVSRPLSPNLARMLGGERRTRGWLLFQTADGEKRRLNPYPDDWVDLSDWMLERWCMRAAHVPPAPARRVQDQTPPE